MHGLAPNSARATAGSRRENWSRCRWRDPLRIINVHLPFLHYLRSYFTYLYLVVIHISMRRRTWWLTSTSCHTRWIDASDPRRSEVVCLLIGEDMQNVTAQKNLRGSSAILLINSGSSIVSFFKYVIILFREHFTHVTERLLSWRREMSFYEVSHLCQIMKSRGRRVDFIVCDNNG